MKRTTPQATISGDCRNASEYADTARHCLRHKLVVPRPCSPSERRVLAETFAEVAKEMGVRG